VFDLDPGPEVRWSQLLAAAVLLRGRLASHGLKSWVKSTGGKGLHVVVPLKPVASWDACFEFSRSLAESIARQERLLTVSFTKAGREKKILIDYKRNYRTSISIATFSTRARPEATLSVPLAWDELSPRQRPEVYTLRNVIARVSAWREDPWREYWRCQQQLALFDVSPEPARAAKGDRRAGSHRYACHPAGTRLRAHRPGSPPLASSVVPNWSMSVTPIAWQSDTSSRLCGTSANCR
jgi:bifunctional non-homologous end joining protein LigD